MAEYKKSGDKAQFYTLSAAAYSVLEDYQYGMERFNQFLKWAMDGYRELNFDVIGDVYTMELDVTQSKQVIAPDDMVDWIKVGIRRGEKLLILAQDKAIPDIYDLDSDNENIAHGPYVPLINELDIAGLPIDYLYNNNGGGEHYYGYKAPHKFSGYFNYDKKNRVFNLKETVSSLSRIYLMYITDGINPNGNTIIHPYAWSTVIAYIKWQRVLNDDRRSIGERREFERLYLTSVQALMERDFNCTLEDLRDTFDGANNLVPNG